MFGRLLLVGVVDVALVDVDVDDVLGGVDPTIELRCPEMACCEESAAIEVLLLNSGRFLVGFDCPVVGDIDCQ
jgi:hypothetical protein